MQITSRANPRIARVRSLRKRSERRATGLAFVEGIQGVVEAAKWQAQPEGADLIEEVLFSPQILDSKIALQTVEDLRGRGVEIVEVSAEVFESLSAREGPQGILAVIRQRWTNLEDITFERSLGWVALEGVADPGNLGSILRTADAVGASGLILLGDTADPYDPSAIKASTGAIFSQRLVRATLTELLQFRADSRFRLIGTSDKARVGYRQARYEKPFVIAMGSEQKGMTPELWRACDEVVLIPMRGSVDSLNLAVATSLVLYAALEANEAIQGHS